MEDGPWVWLSASFSYCCIINYHTIWVIQLFLFGEAQFCGSEVWPQHDWVLCSASSEAKLRCLQLDWVLAYGLWGGWCASDGPVTGRVTAYGWKPEVPLSSVAVCRRLLSASFCSLWSSPHGPFPSQSQQWRISLKSNLPHTLSHLLPASGF